MREGAVVALSILTMSSPWTAKDTSHSQSDLQTPEAPLHHPARTLHFKFLVFETTLQLTSDESAPRSYSSARTLHFKLLVFETSLQLTSDKSTPRSSSSGPTLLSSKGAKGHTLRYLSVLRASEPQTSVQQPQTVLAGSYNSVEMDKTGHTYGPRPPPTPANPPHSLVNPHTPNLSYNSSLGPPPTYHHNRQAIPQDQPPTPSWTPVPSRPRYTSRDTNTGTIHYPVPVPFPPPPSGPSHPLGQRRQCSRYPHVFFAMRRDRIDERRVQDAWNRLRGFEYVDIDYDDTGYYFVFPDNEAGMNGCLSMVKRYAGKRIQIFDMYTVLTPHLLDPSKRGRHTLHSESAAAGGAPLVVYVDQRKMSTEDDVRKKRPLADIPREPKMESREKRGKTERCYTIPTPRPKLDTGACGSSTAAKIRNPDMHSRHPATPDSICQLSSFPIHEPTNPPFKTPQSGTRDKCGSHSPVGRRWSTGGYTPQLGPLGRPPLEDQARVHIPPPHATTTPAQTARYKRVIAEK